MKPSPREIITFNEKGRHLTYEQRKILARAWNAAVRNLQANLTFKGFARRLGICRATWVHEYYQGGGTRPVRDYKHPGRRLFGEYNPDLAQERHTLNATQKGRRMLYTNKIDRAFARLIHDKRRNLSPADARIELIRKHPDWRVPSLSTFYHHIRNGTSSVKQGETPYHPGEPRKERRRAAHPAKTSPGRRVLADRPAPANERSEPGHKEVDIVESCVGGCGGVLVAIDRATRHYVTRKLSRTTKRAVLAAIRALRKSGAFGTVLSVTADNGCQFIDQAALDHAFGAPTYYTRAYASWEKGSVENCNRHLRRWFPKGTDFSRVAPSSLAWATRCINAIHRRSLGGLSSDEYCAIHPEQAPAETDKTPSHRPILLKVQTSA